MAKGLVSKKGSVQGKKQFVENSKKKASKLTKPTKPKLDGTEEFLHDLDNCEENSPPFSPCH
jgi:hypothetical protein